MSERDGNERKRQFLDLMLNPEGKARRKAIATIMRKKNISFEEAKKYQALKITGLTKEEL